jgi:ribose transport system substrate-binding protein
MKRRSPTPPRAALIVVVGLVCVLAASGFAVAKTAADPVVQTLPYVTFHGPWLVWDKSTCRYVTTTKHPATYVAQMRKQSTPLRFVYTAYQTTSSTGALINAGVKSAAVRAGVQFNQLSNNYPSTSDPLTVADQAVTLKADIVLSSSIISTLQPQIQAKYEAACIPMINMFDIPGLPHAAPGYQSGFAAEGKAIADATIPAVRSRHWPASDTWLVLCGDPTTGTGPNTLYDVPKTFARLVTKSLGLKPKNTSGILACNQSPGPSSSRTVVTDWLTAHPQAHHLIVMTYADTLVAGMVQAVQAKGFTSSTAIAASGDASDPVLRQMAKQGSKSILQVDADKFFLRWGVYGVSIAQDILAGRPVPSFMDPGTTAVTPKTASATIKARAAVVKKYGGG